MTMTSGRISTRRSRRRTPGLLTAAGVTLAASVAGAVVNFALAVVVARAYGAGDTGTFFAVIGVFLVVANVLKLGADTGLVRAVSRAIAVGRPQEVRPTVLSAVIPVLVVSVAVAVLGSQHADTLARLIGAGNTGPAAALIRVMAFAVPLLTVFSLLMAAVRGLGAVIQFALWVNVALPVSRVAGVAIAAALGFSVLGAAQAWTAGLPLLLIVALVALRRAECHNVGRAPMASDPPPEGAAQPFLAFWRFSLPRAGSAAIEISIEWFDVIAVSLLAGPLEAGLYAVATRIVKVASIASYALRVALATPITAALATGDTERVRRLFDLGTRLLVALVWPYLGVLVVFGDVAMNVFGHDFEPGSWLLVIVATGMLAAAAGGALQSVLLLSGLSAQQLGNKVVVLAVSVLGTLLATPIWGARGAAGVWVAAALTDTVLAAVVVRRRLAVRWRWEPIRQVGMPALVCSMSCSGVVRMTFGASPVTLVAAGVLAVAGYALVLRRTGQWQLLQTLALAGDPATERALTPAAGGAGR